MKWFRLYDDLVFNAKAQSLPPILFKHWINLLCLASRNEPRGILPPMDRVAFALRMRPNRAKAVIQSLVSRGFLSELGQIHDWNSTQFQSDDSAVRKKAQRVRDLRKNVTGHSRDQTASDTDTEQIQIQRQREGDLPTAEKRSGKTDPAAEQFREAYLANIGNPYEWKSGDFPLMAKLRKRFSLGTLDTPADWGPAIQNYFASPWAAYSLQHFVSSFDTYKNSPLDRYGKPTNHVNGGNGNGQRAESPLEQTRRASEKLFRRMDGKT